MPSNRKGVSPSMRHQLFALQYTPIKITSSELFRVSINSGETEEVHILYYVSHRSCPIIYLFVRWNWIKYLENWRKYVVKTDWTFKEGAKVLLVCGVGEIHGGCVCSDGHHSCLLGRPTPSATTT